MARRRNRLVALVATVAIVLAQTVAVAYACTRSAGSTPMASTAIVPCEGHDRAGGNASDGGADNLCEVHCQATPLSSPVVIAMAPPPAVAITVDGAVGVGEGVAARAPDAKSAAPPLRERYCRLQL
jgi:hypothetical protein